MAASASPAAPGPARRRVPPVVLVGMMGAGKSTVGRRLASRLGRPFVDADDELVRRSGRTVREWFAEEGEDGFRAAEAALLADLLAAPGPAVIAAGGGVVTRPRNREALRGGARVVYLRAGAPFLRSRLERKPHRPLLDDDPEAVLVRLLDERSALYEEVADLVVDVEPFHSEHERPKRELAARIAELVEAAEATGAAEVDRAAGRAGEPGR
ncbi:MAG TPA: shikimate kinase [Acidimicrobiales bacterium]|nr:shikimate kinase [Acidimicrobiales bacterium]